MAIVTLYRGVEQITVPRELTAMLTANGWDIAPTGQTKAPEQTEVDPVEVDDPAEDPDKSDD